MPTEAEWQQQVVQLAEILGWQWLHVRKSLGRRDGKRGWQTTTNLKGWVDLTLWHPRHGLIFVEFKSAGGKVTPEQEAVHVSLRAAGQRVFVWRPGDLEDVQRVLNPSRG